jgi:transporter family-2 protein
MGALAFLFAAIAGILNTVQSGSNATLGKTVAPGWAVAVIGAATMLTGVAYALATRAPLPRSGMHLVPWWGWVGGMLGAVYVLATLLVSRQMGAGVFIGLTVTAAIVTSLAMDHWGLLGFQVHPANAWRLAGGALMIAGLALVAKF